ncbi:hypothetical protein FF011L_28550 [Roseimaritima multifibrata]|uniref:Uncharacterized protein n=1 Tax=Roseimaritima multifibrata TaxID=1930274 RepID=A0A517MH24_9BACT|nr:hypothetical protein FF011L_28550 [Roseimaritima multifibrata]
MWGGLHVLLVLSEAVLVLSEAVLVLSEAVLVLDSRIAFDGTSTAPSERGSKWFRPLATTKRQSNVFDRMARNANSVSSAENGAPVRVRVPGCALSTSTSTRRGGRARLRKVRVPYSAKRYSYSTPALHSTAPRPRHRNVGASGSNLWRKQSNVFDRKARNAKSVSSAENGAPVRVRVPGCALSTSTRRGGRARLRKVRVPYSAKRCSYSTPALHSTAPRPRHRNVGASGSDLWRRQSNVFDRMARNANSVSSAENGAPVRVRVPGCALSTSTRRGGRARLRKVRVLVLSEAVLVLDSRIACDGTFGRVVGRWEQVVQIFGDDKATYSTERRETLSRSVVLKMVRRFE